MPRLTINKGQTKNIKSNSSTNTPSINVEQIPPPSTTIQVKKTKVKSIRPPNTRCSNFFITVNTNESMFNKPDEEIRSLIEEFEGKIELFLKVDLFPGLMILSDSKEATEEYDNIPLVDRFIKQFDNQGNQTSPGVEYCTEIGETRGWLHSHMTLQTKHRALNVKLDYSRINRYWKDKLNGKAHVHIDLVRDSKMTLRDYMLKQNDKYKY